MNIKKYLLRFQGVKLLNFRKICSKKIDLETGHFNDLWMNFGISLLPSLPPIPFWRRLNCLLKHIFMDETNLIGKIIENFIQNYQIDYLIQF